jgi:predicted DNA-binding protein with PD1-like motif
MENTEKSIQENNQFNEEQIKKMLVQEFIDEFKKLNKFKKITVRNFFYSKKNEYLKISVKEKNMIISIKDEILKKQKVNFKFDFDVIISCEEIYNLLKNNK